MKRRLSLCLRYWSYCNNRCSFCFEDTNAFDELKSKFHDPSVFAIDENNARAAELISASEYDFYTFKLMGGELFCFNRPEITKKLVETVEWIYSVYETHNLLNEISENKKDIPETLVIASNLMFSDREPLSRCLDVLKGKQNINASTMLSFDLAGRFMSSKTLTEYYDNILYLVENYSDTVKLIPSLVLSRQNMDILTNARQCSELDIFDKMYDSGLTFDIQLLLNDAHIGMFAYSERELKNFVLRLRDRYPRLVEVFKARTLYKQYITTRKTIQCGKVYDEESFYNKSGSDNCLTCGYYKCCHHSYSGISYNATDCDAKEFLKQCEI